MGQRANLIIVENGKYELYYDHWCANSLDSYLFWGPEEVVSFIRKHDPEKGYWLNDIWCEGAALVDLDNKKLLFFGGEDILYDIPQRKIYLELLAEMWKGYEIKWAYRGIVDLAKYIGYDWKSLMDRTETKKCSIENSLDSDGGDYITGVLSIADKDNTVKIFPLFSYENSLLFCDSRKVTEYLNKLQDRSKLFEEKRYEDCSFPSYGMHIDMGKKTMFFWDGDTSNVNYYDKTADFWNGWKTHYFYDDYQKHADLIKNNYIFPEIDYEKYVGRIKSMVCQENKNPTDTIQNILEVLKNNGNKNVEVNPAVYAANSFDMPKDSREEIFKMIACKYLEKIKSGK